VRKEGRKEGMILKGGRQERKERNGTERKERNRKKELKDVWNDTERRKKGRRERNGKEGRN
jgi:hypothetical protein